MVAITRCLTLPFSMRSQRLAWFIIDYEKIYLASAYKSVDFDAYVPKRNGFGNLIALELTEMEYIAQTLLDEVTYKEN